MRGALERAADAGEALLRPLRAVSTANRQGAVMGETAHRPWPLPDSPWLMAQTWEDLLFAHWSVPEADLRARVPAAIPIDTFEGQAYVGVTPFRVGALRLRGMPHVPRLTSFPEINVRTYSTVEDRPGIFFLSLDAASLPAVASARRAFRLPYFRARMSLRRRGAWIDYGSERAEGHDAPAAFRASYRPTGEVFQAREGSLEHWLTERYCLYTLDERRRVQRADIHHPPWPLQAAEAEIALNTMAAPYGLDLASPAPLLHFAARQDVVIWPIAAVADRR